MDAYEAACTIAKEVGSFIRTAGQSGLSIGHKDGNVRDIVTNIDREANERIIEKIRTWFPEDDIYSEEGEGSDHGSARRWVIDPLDGTSNFSRGIPFYAVSIGLLENGVPTVGSVYIPATDELFGFVKGKGATLNGSPIHVSPVPKLADAQVAFSPGSRNPELYDWAGYSYRALIEHAKKRGVYGCSAIDLCYLAAGRIDAGVYGTLTTLDIAGALGILTEAGGFALAADGSPLAFTDQPQKVYFGNSRDMAQEIRTLLEG